MNQDLQTFTLANNSALRISREEIVLLNSRGMIQTKEPLGIRYGTAAIDVYHFRLGYSYNIQILTEEKEIITVPFKTYFGIDRTRTFKRYNEVVDCLWEAYFNDFYAKLVNDYNEGADLVFEEKYTLTGDGLMLNTRDELIPFENMKLEKRFDHFVVNATNNPKLYTNIYYLNTWNAVMIFSILQSILKGDTHSV